MDSRELKDRTKRLAVAVIHAVRELPRTEEARIIGRQVLRSATSIAANYRAVCRARSKAEFVAKLGLVVEEADETVFWIELLGDSRIVSIESLEPLQREANEVLAIVAASLRTVKHSPVNEKLTK